MNKWAHLPATFPGLGWEDVCAKLGITQPSVKAEIRAAILSQPDPRQSHIHRPAHVAPAASRTSDGSPMREEASND